MQSLNNKSHGTGGACNGDAQLRTVARRSVEHLRLPSSHTLRGYVSHTLRDYVSFAKACKRPSVSSGCATQLSVKSAPMDCAREPFEFIWSLYRKMDDTTGRSWITRSVCHHMSAPLIRIPFSFKLTPTHIRFARTVCKRVQVLPPRWSRPRWSRIWFISAP